MLNNSLTKITNRIICEVFPICHLIGFFLIFRIQVAEGYLTVA